MAYIFTLPDLYRWNQLYLFVNGNIWTQVFLLLWQSAHKQVFVEKPSFICRSFSTPSVHFQQLNYMPPDRSVDFDFTKRGLLVFADKSVTAGTPCTSAGPKAPAFTPNLGVNEFNMIIQQMAKVRLSGSVNQTFFHFGAFHTAFFVVCLEAWCLLTRRG